MTVHDIYKVDRKSSFSYFFSVLLLLLYSSLYMYYTLLFLLFPFLLLTFSSSMPLYNFHTTYYTIVFCLGILASDSPKSLSSYTCISYTLQTSLPLTLLFILSLLLLHSLEDFLLLHNILLSFSLPFLYSLFFPSLSQYQGIPTLYVLFPNI